MSLVEIAAYLEKHGWRRDIAGQDFTPAVQAIDFMQRETIGIIVAGEYGVGKSKLCEIIANGFGGAFKVNLGVREELEKLTPAWRDYYGERVYTRNVYLDDLGAEHQTNEWGVRSETVADFICGYHLRKSANVRLIISTNLNEEQLDARYGGRLVSRLRELCTPLLLRGEDKRKWKTPQM